MRGVLGERFRVAAPPATRLERMLGVLGSGKGRQVLGTPSASTTVQAAGLALAEVVPPTGAHGIMLGLDIFSGQPVIHDPFVAYSEEPGFSSPNVSVFGDLGSGKSQMTKAWILRNLMLGRRVVVVDKKPQMGADGAHGLGEYSMLARAMGYEPVSLRVGGGGARVNILDPRITGDDAGAGAQLLLESVVGAAMGRDLDEMERKALRTARVQAMEVAARAGRVAHVGDVQAAMMAPAEPAPGSGYTAEDLARWGRAAAFALERMVADELAGLIDGETSADLALDGQLIVYDISALPEEGPAVPIMMSVLNTWVRSALASQEVPVPTVLVIDEAWHIVTGSYAEVARRNAKVSRGLGLSNWSNFQHVSDIPAGSPAVAMIRETQTTICFRQSKMDDAVGICELLGWDPGLAERITRLGQGVAMVGIGSAPPVICSMMMSDLELTVGDTNQAMTSTATMHRPGTKDDGTREGADGGN